jgi:hypothetical protein
MIKEDKFTKVIKKELKVYESAKAQKVIAKNGTFFLEKGDKFQLITEQSIESEKVGNDIVTAINAELKDSPIEVKISSDDSENLNGVSTTNIVFAVCTKADATNELMTINAEGLEFTTEFDAMLSTVLIDTFGFKAEEIGANKVDNTFWVMKTVIEDVPETEVVEPKVELLSGEDFDEEPIAFVDTDFTDDMYTESTKTKEVKKSKYTESKFVKVLFKEADAEDNEKKKDDEEEAKKDKDKKDKEDKEDKKKEESKSCKESDDEDMDDEEDKKKEEAVKKDKNGKWPFEKGYIKDDEEDDKKDDKEDKEDKKEMKESYKFNPAQKQSFLL